MKKNRKFFFPISFLHVVVRLLLLLLIIEIMHNNNDNNNFEKKERERVKMAINYLKIKYFDKYTIITHHTPNTHNTTHKQTNKHRTQCENFVTDGNIFAHSSLHIIMEMIIF